MRAPEESSRTAMLLGSEAVARLARCKVAVFGIGGVGSFAAEALARAGVGTLVLVDADVVHPSNLNRQLVALHSTLGRPKVEVMRERILDIDPTEKVEIHQAFYLPGEGDALLTPDLDYVVDAVDTVAAKVGLAVRAGELGIPIVSCMGAGNKLDPARFEVADVYSTRVCPLAKAMRRELRARGVERLKVVYSAEEPRKPAEPDAVADAAPPGKHPPGSVSFVPSAAGLVVAGVVIRDLISGKEKTDP